MSEQRKYTVDPPCAGAEQNDSRRFEQDAKNDRRAMQNLVGPGGRKDLDLDFHRGLHINADKSG